MMDVIKSLNKTKAHIEGEVKKLEMQLHSLLQTWGSGQLKNLSSIPRQGRRAVALLIVYTDGFKKVQNRRRKPEFITKVL